MAQTVVIPSTTLPVGSYGPFVVDNIPANSKGVRLVLDRSTDGIWPLTATDVVLRADVEGLFPEGWLLLSRVEFWGGRIPTNVARPALLQAQAEILWSRENPTLVHPPVWVYKVPSQARVNITVFADTPTGGTFQWL